MKYLCFTVLLFFAMETANAQGEVNYKKEDVFLVGAHDEKKISVGIYNSEHRLASYLKTFSPKPATVSASTNDKVFLDFIGTGDIQKSISDGSGIQANTSLGALFERYSGNNRVIQSFSLEALINVATTADTISAKFNDKNELTNSRNFGTYILNPVSAKQAFFLNSNVYFGTNRGKNGWDNFFKIISGFNTRVISSNNVWNHADTAIINVSAMSFRFGLFHEFIPDNYRLESDGKDVDKSKFSISLGLNYSFRGIYGDVKSSINNSLRNRFIGSEQVAYHGLETNFILQLRNIRAEFQVPIFNGSKSVDGLTNTQFQFSVKFVGGIPLRIDKKKSGKVEEESDSNG